MYFLSFRNLSDKITIYHQLFCTNMPTFFMVDLTFLSLLLQAVEVVFKFCIVSVVISLFAAHIVLFYELFKRILLVYILFHNICIFNVCHIPFLSPPLPDDCCLAAVRHVCVCLRVQAQGVV